jgi:hypothetical protein
LSGFDKWDVPSVGGVKHREHKYKPALPFALRLGDMAYLDDVPFQPAIYCFFYPIKRAVYE